MRFATTNLLAGASLLVLASTANAQTAPNGSSAASALEEFIVTARRVEERLQDVPISMTVFNQQQLAGLNVVNAGDLAKITPSLTANGRFGAESTSFSIRGFIQEIPTSPTVAVYFADVVGLRASGGTTAGNGAGPGNYFDLQNVQVLKGPQGTLFGRNTTGGAILLVPQRPTSDFGGYVEGSAGNYDMRRVQAVMNVPLADNFRLRLGVDDNTREGYQRNISFVPGAPVVGPRDFADINYTAVRLSAVWDVTPNIENYSIASWSDSDTNGGSVPKMVVALPTTRGAPTYRYANYQAQVDALAGDYYDVSNGNQYAHQRIKQRQLINSTTWKATDTLTLKNIVSYGEFQQAQAQNIYGDNGVTVGNPLHYHEVTGINPGPGKNNVSQSTFTEELQLQGQATERLSYQLGAYFEQASPLDGFQEVYSPGSTDCIDVLSLNCTDTRGRLTPNGSGGTLEGSVANVSISRSKYHFRNRALYAQSTYAFNDHWSLTGGIRYTSDDVSGVGQPLRVRFPAPNAQTYSCANPTGVVQGGTSAQIQADPARCNLIRNSSSSKPTWLIDLDYKPIDDVLIYAKHARGYRQGSINVTSYGLETWEPESVDTYEIGTKTEFRSFVSGTFNIAVFYNDFTDMQLQLGTLTCTGAQTISNPQQCPFVPSPTAGIANAGKSTIEGIETELSLNLFSGFNVDASYTYLDTKIKTIELPPPPLGFTGLTTVPAGGPVPYTPRNKYSVTASYTVPLSASVGEITLTANGTFQSSTTGSATSVASGLYILPAQRLYNANVNWNSMFGLPMDLSLFATNLTQEKFHTFSVGTSFGFDSVLLNEPRMYGARMKYRFGN